MKIITLSRGNVGGGLAALWRNASHEVTELGRDGGDASEADVVVAVPGPTLSDAHPGQVIISVRPAWPGRL